MNRLILLIMLFVSTAGEAQVSSQIIEHVSKSVVLIEARQCNGEVKSRNGSGFTFGNSLQIVTAYHVVGGCKQLTVLNVSTGRTVSSTATITHVLKSNDLALIVVDKALSESFLSNVTAASLNTKYMALGFALGIPTQSQAEVSVAFNSNSLREMLPADYQQQLALTAIDIQQRIIRFYNPLMPGMSGGPIFDEKGNVIAVVAGGLMSGEIPASWGWPSEIIPQSLLQSSEEVNENAVVPKGVFAFSIPGISTRKGATLQCGGLMLTEGEEITFSDAARTSDDIAKLYNTISFSGVSQGVIEQFHFQTWKHSASGAIIVIPDNIPLTQENQTCVARSSDGNFEQIISAQAVQNSQEVNQAYQLFEQNVFLAAMQPNIGVQQDSVLTTGTVRRADGFIVDRKGFFVGRQWINPGQVRASHLFETAMSRGGSFTGITMINNRVDQCFNQFHVLALCSPNQDYLEEWAKFVLATQMSTYQVY